MDPDIGPSSSSRRLSSHVPARQSFEKAMSLRPLVDQADRDSISSEASLDSAQAGVKRLEAIASTWSKFGLFVAYFGLGLVTYATSLEQQTTVQLTIFATSAFDAHSLVSTVLVVQGVVLSVVKPPMSKIADVFGRFEAFALSVFIYTIGYIQQAAADNVKTYAAAQLFYSAGSTGLQILIQIFIADTSDLMNRALCATLPDVPFLINVWLGPPLAASLLPDWRWGYGIWAIVLPIAFLPMALALYTNQRKASKRGILPPSPLAGKGIMEIAENLWYELDFFGLVLLSTGIALVLIPLTIASKAGWNNVSIIAMLIVGATCLCAFPYWERSTRLAPRAFFPKGLFRQTTVLAGLGVAFFYFMAFYLSVYPYFQSYLLVVQGESVKSAGYIVQTFTFASTVTSLVVSFVIKYTHHYKYFVTLGACVYLLGLGLMIQYRVEGVGTSIIVATQMIIGVGGGMLNVPAQLGVQASASHQEVATATACFLTLLEIGGAVGAAISGAIWTNSVPHKLAQYLPPEAQDQAKAIFGNVTLASTGWPMGSPTRVAINRAYQETMTRLLIVALCVSVPCVILSLLMENYNLGEINQHVKGVVIGSTQDATDHREAEPLAQSSGVSYGSSGSSIADLSEERPSNLSSKMKDAWEHLRRKSSS
ncbi:putative siderophore-dependent iron transporter [Polychaeton citri CBS 116435]|uniref:Siderophore-dependent iron transporter n=1 Tax=Polychaeton citri CBS 116435 TaxID=1314669 RepID=A0A9P4UN87_9PEZI|nr:putative siderophore-dependent iron transporter [Polychaeton citri CBS 116435]